MTEWQWRKWLHELTLIREQLKAIQNQLKSIDENQKAAEKSSDEKTPKPIIVTEFNLPVAITDYYESQSRQTTSKVWAWLKPWIECGSFLALVVYVVITARTFHEISEQTKFAETGNRPWIKIIEIRPEPMDEEPTFTFLKAPNIWVGEPRPSASVSTEFLIKNIGKSVAQNITIYPTLHFHSNPSNYAEEQRGRVCSAPRELQAAAGFTWSAIFPDEEVKARVGTVGTYGSQNITRTGGSDYVDVELVGCVAYQYPRSYQTRAVYQILDNGARYLRIGTSIDRTRIRFLRDEHGEYAQ